jgi:integrase
MRYGNRPKAVTFTAQNIFQEPNLTVTTKTIARLARTPGRHPVEAKGAHRLFLTVKPNGLCYWTMRFRLNGRDTETSLGAYPDLEIKDAVAAHVKKLALLADGIDPQAGKRKRAPSAPKGSAPTFGEAGQALLERRAIEKGWRSPKHRQQWRATLARLPEWFRALQTTAITVEDVHNVVAPVWIEKPETGSRLRSRIELVIDSARDSTDTRPNPAALSGWLKTRLGAKRLNKNPVTGKRAHHRALHHDAVPTLMARLRARPGVVAQALQFLILTAARAGEVREATWDEIVPNYGDDVTTPIPVWVVPANRMKAFRRWRVPLSRAAVAVLGAQHGEDDGLIFPGSRPKRPLTNTTLMNELARLGFAGLTTTHGLRGTFRSWCKATGVPFQTAEEALAHAVGNSVSQAYDHDDQLALRAELMERWGRYCLSLRMLPKPIAA